jgi:hypothetical protein
MRSFVPFEVTVARDGETATRVFSDRLGMLDGVNTAGEASGTGTQKPIGKNVEGSGYFVVPPGSNDFIPLQPQCVGLTEACLEPNDILTSCHFGGCSIDNAGLLLGSDRATRRPMTYTYGRPDSGRDLPFAYSAPSNPLTPQLVLNDSGQVLYNTLVSGAVVPYVFAIATSQSKRIPPLPNNSCSSYIASSMNDEGDVLGYTTTCTQPGDAVFWTWSARGGIVNLNARVQLGPYSSVYPIGINNHGSILAMLYRSTSNDGDWGTLEPISADPLPLNKTLPSRQTPPSR